MCKKNLKKQIELPWRKNLASTAQYIQNYLIAVWTLLGLISSVYYFPPLEIEPATTECRAKTLPPSCRSTLHTSDAKLTSHGKCMAINLKSLVVTSVLLQRTWLFPQLRLSKRIGDTHSRDHNLMGREIDIHFLLINRGITSYKLNYYDQTIRQALHATYGITGQLFQPY